MLVRNAQDHQFHMGLTAKDQQQSFSKLSPPKSSMSLSQKLEQSTLDQEDQQSEQNEQPPKNNQMFFPENPADPRSKSSMTGIMAPLSPSLFKVSPSEALRDTNDTAPSSVDEEMPQTPQMSQSHRSEDKTTLLDEPASVAEGYYHSSVATLQLQTAQSSSNKTSNTIVASSSAAAAIHHPPQSPTEASMMSLAVSLALRTKPVATRRHTTHGGMHKITPLKSNIGSNGPVLPVSDVTKRSSLKNSVSSAGAVPYASTRRSRTSLDTSIRQDATNLEISRMRESILEKRNLKKRRREFLDDERVLVGNKISEGHENFVMAYNMLTGIRVAVLRCLGVMNKLTDDLFTATKKLTFNVDGSELTPSSKYDFKFKDYCPEVFRELRTMFGLDPADYLVSITGKYILSELGSPGKSGSFFYFSRDYRFIIKTIHHAEHKQLIRILKDYYSHVKSNPNTLISQIYGLHRVKMPLKNGSRKVHFLVMNNLFPPHRDIHYKYDLKGSTWGRKTVIESEETVSKHTLKDLNWLERKDSIKFGPAKRDIFCNQLDSDVKFLQKVNVMDYSLLLGVHDVKKGNSQQTSNKLSVFDPKSTTKSGLLQTNLRDVDREVDLPLNVFPGRSQFVFYGHDGGIRSTDEDDRPTNEIYYLGIIDCLTNYSMKKRLETFWRSLNHKREEISAVPAHEYGERFLKFIKKGLKTEKRREK